MVSESDTVAMPLPFVTEVAAATTMEPLVTFQETVAPDTGLLFTSVAFTEIGCHDCRVQLGNWQNTWPLPDCTDR
jgi:hypothetical protein